MIELWLLRIAVVWLYVAGACITSAWAYADGRIRAPDAWFHIAIWPWFALKGVLWGVWIRFKRWRARG